jgi:branched-chain amino acid aminotransferase
MSIQVTPEALSAIQNFQLPKAIGFGTVMAPIMLMRDWHNGKWSEATIVPYGPISFYPTAKVLHYAQEIFEGLKAYKVQGKGPFLFRPIENARRFNYSATQMSMPTLDEQFFVDSVITIARLCHNAIPNNSGESLYIRPFLFATEETLGIKSSNSFRYMVIASPSGAYINSESMPVMIERERVRACPGGVGTAKTGGNYAASILSSIAAQKLGCLQTLWLDATHRRYIEEMSGMNFMCVINGKLVTPKLNDTILKGITRESVLERARNLGIATEERSLSIDEVIEGIQSRTLTEAFACGTAAIISPISTLVEQDASSYALPAARGPIGTRLRQDLLDIQEGREKDPHGWRIDLSKKI